MARHERAALLSRIVSGPEEAATVIIDSLILVGVKPRQFAEQKLARSMATFGWAAEEAKCFAGEVIPMDGMARGSGYEVHTLRESIGPVLGIYPSTSPSTSRRTR